MTSGSDQPKIYVKEEVREIFQPKKHQTIRAWWIMKSWVVHPSFGGIPTLTPSCLAKFLFGDFSTELWCYL